MSRTVTLLGYAVIAGCAVAVEVAGRRGRRGAPLSRVLSTALARRPVRLAVLAAWLWLGWHVFVRVDWR